ncbi:MAG: CDP-diacylglycerol--serine O-phosphatidyltransferase [Frankiaceae bacterium]
MPGHLTLPNIITGGNLTAGFFALVALEGGSARAALALVCLAAVCDVLDGVVARRGSQESEFGMNLDSLADVVSFGVVPAFGLHIGPLAPLSGFGTAACVAFLVAGAWRLARYPLVKQSACFVGLPIPLAGVLVMVLVVTGPPAVLTLVLTVVLSALMVSTLPCPTVGMALRWLASPRIRKRRSVPMAQNGRGPSPNGGAADPRGRIPVVKSAAAQHAHHRPSR